MTPEPPSPYLDLLVVGGLTVDRFADGSSAPGGSVLHAARAVAKRGITVGVVTSAGTEPEAQSAVSELRRSAAWLEVSPSETTTTFRHREGPHGRRLWLERVGGTISLSADARDRIFTSAILYAPVAGEVRSESLAIWVPYWSRCAILQGWLRRRDSSGEVEPTSLGTIEPEAAAALGTFNLIIASREDLLADSPDPYDQLDRLRARFGRQPVLVVTDGIDGLWIDFSGVARSLDHREHIPAPFTVAGTNTVGAGDMLAALLIARRNDSAGWVTWVQDAMRAVADELASRRSPA